MQSVGSKLALGTRGFCFSGLVLAVVNLNPDKISAFASGDLPPVVEAGRRRWILGDEPQSAREVPIAEAIG